MMLTTACGGQCFCGGARTVWDRQAALHKEEGAATFGRQLRYHSLVNQADGCIQRPLLMKNLRSMPHR
jgi:hypothetical protein